MAAYGIVLTVLDWLFSILFSIMLGSQHIVSSGRVIGIGERGAVRALFLIEAFNINF